MTFADLAKRAERLIANNSPIIMTGIGVTGTLMTAYLTGKASFKAAELIADKEHDFGSGLSFKYGLRDRVELCWKLYIPSAITAGLTVASIVTANRVGTRRAAALAAAFSLTERGFEEYRAKIIEKIGDKKEQSYHDEIAQERVNRDPVGNREVILAGSGSVLCYEAFTGRYFISDMQVLKEAENKINHQILHDSYAALTDFYDLVGLPATSNSGEVGWNADRLLELKFSTTLTEDNRPCMVVGFSIAPIRHYNQFN